LLAEVHPGVTEFQLDGILEESFKRRGAQYMAFPAIVGSGENTTILHYEKRDHTLGAGQLLLLDVGAEWERYAADISRTIPIDGTFTPEQAKIYDIVLAAQNAAIAVIKPGATVRDVNEAARDVIRKAGHIDDFIHSTSHHVGIDVHDVADYGLPLRAGMVITVEPGIYLPGPAIGVRIEDDILVTKTGYRILSEKIPRERTAVEQWLAAARK
ncbi:MAG: M24 family metallopeptidase, partial [candidate division Zixibacteria bacterium]|nr:M24 family metallopeptidase [candidate division Zixibacteria bacterium]